MSALDGVRAMHGDVLDCKPSDDESRDKLVEELKNRGNLAFKAKRMDEAILMYTEALKHNPSLHTVLGNRSMVHLNKGDLKPALDDANAAIKLDPKWIKGHYRKGMALEKMKKWGEAYDSLKVAAEAAPKDKKLKEKVDGLYKKACRQLERGEVEIAPAPEPSRGSGKESSTHKVSTAPPPKMAAPSKKTSSETVVVKGDKEGGNMKGYKTMANGKKTSFFHTEISEEAKAMLAQQGGPKQLTAAEAKRAAEAEVAKAAAGGSTWNSAKTFEERDMNVWAKRRVHELLESISLSVEGKAESISVKKLTDYEGDASMPIIRGTKRHIFDLSFTAEWVAKMADGKKLKGEMHLPDVASDGTDDEFEMEFKIRTETTDENRNLVRENLNGAINAALCAFVAEFNEK